jgi:hypothetical protein
MEDAVSDPGNDPSFVEVDDDELSEDQGKRSGERPAARFFEPLPLGSNAFAAPLAPEPSERPGPLARIPTLALVLLGAAGVAGAAVAVAIALRSAKAPEPVASPAPPSARTAPAADDTPAASPAPAAVPALAPLHEVALRNPEEGVDDTPSNAAAAAPKRAEPAPASSATEAKSAAPDESHGSTHSRSHHSHAAQGLPAQPDRAQVMAAMNALRPDVNACFGDKHGTATAEIRAAGRTGRVISARVQGQTGSVGSCIARAVRKAHFPRFAAESIAISYPFAH